MEVSPFGNAQWVCSERFVDREPVDVFHRYMQEKEIPLPDEDKNTHMLVRRIFSITSCPQKAVLRLTAADYYKLYINEQFVGRGPAQGYRFCYYWNEYDVTSYLKEGENEIFADVYWLGRHEVAYALITSKEKNSWYHMCEQGATTCFEVWDKDQKFNTSLCHPWASAPISVLIEDLAPHMTDRFRIVYANNFRKS